MTRLLVVRPLLYLILLYVDIFCILADDHRYWITRRKIKRNEMISLSIIAIKMFSMQSGKGNFSTELHLSIRELGTEAA
jgi:hypothetical protein